MSEYEEVEFVYGEKTQRGFIVSDTTIAYGEEYISIVNDNGMFFIPTRNITKREDPYERAMRGIA